MERHGRQVISLSSLQASVLMRALKLYLQCASEHILALEADGCGKHILLEGNEESG